MDQVSFADVFTVCVKWNPSILTSVWYGMFIVSVAVSHIPSANARFPHVYLRPSCGLISEQDFLQFSDIHRCCKKYGNVVSICNYRRFGLPLSDLDAFEFFFQSLDQLVEA